MSLDEAMIAEPIYQPNERFHSAFYEFAHRLNSLQRHWLATRDSIEGYLSRLRDLEMDGTAEMELFRDEMLLPDSEYFPGFLRGAVLAHGLALIETMLDDVANDVASELRSKVELDQRPLPYVNRFILFLTSSCGLTVEISKELWKQLDAVRELRNRYIHKLDRALPAHIRETLTEMASGVESSDLAVDDVFVDRSINVFADIGRRVEEAYWQWYDARAPRNRA